MLVGIRQRLTTPALLAGLALQLQQEHEQAHRELGGTRTAIEVVDTRPRIAKLVRRIEDDNDALRVIECLSRSSGPKLTDELTDVPEPQVVRLPTNY